MLVGNQVRGTVTSTYYFSAFVLFIDLVNWCIVSRGSIPPHTLNHYNSTLFVDKKVDIDVNMLLGKNGSYERRSFSNTTQRIS